MEKQGTNLAYLMSVFGISNYNLAGVLNVHFSLISKWKNGIRHLSEKSPYFEKVASYFESLDAENRFRRLRGILSEAFPEADLSTDETLSQYLRRWLSGEQNRERELTTEDVKKIYRSAIFDVYQGYGGKIDCIRRLIEYGISLPPGQKLFIWKNHPMHALLEQKEFIPSNNERYRRFIAKSGHINTIHSLYRSPQEIFYAILQKLPFHVTGRCTDYCEYDYSNSDVKYSIYLLEDEAAAVTLEYMGNKNSSVSYFLTDKLTVRSIYNILSSKIKSCNLLYDKDRCAGSDQYCSLVVESLLAPGTAYCLMSYCPPLFMMDEARFAALTAENGLAEDEAAELCQAHRRMHQAFLQSLKTCDFRVIAVPQVEPPSKGDGCFYEHFLHRPLAVPPAIYRAFLQDFERLQRENPSFQVLVSRDLFLPRFNEINVFLKEGKNLIATSTENADRIPIAIEEPIILRAFNTCLKYSWYTIPRDSNRMSLLSLTSGMTDSAREKPFHE